MFKGLFCSDEKAALALSIVLILMPNHATAYEPRIPKRNIKE